MHSTPSALETARAQVQALRRSLDAQLTQTPMSRVPDPLRLSAEPLTGEEITHVLAAYGH